jgi:hypothetical protein
MGALRALNWSKVLINTVCCPNDEFECMVRALQLLSGVVLDERLTVQEWHASSGPHPPTEIRYDACIFWRSAPQLASTHADSLLALLQHFLAMHIDMKVHHALK